MSILTVSQLTQSIKKNLESEFPFIAVRAEVSNCKRQASGHLYFTLKDSEAQLSAVLFRGSASGLSRLPQEGDQVIAKGSISLYPARGQYQLIVRDLEYGGVGELLQRLHALKLKLEQLGWFDSEKKKKIPKFPKIIGVVTSSTGAVIQDILHILTRRLGIFHLVLNPVRVQGEGAAEEIARAIAEFDYFQLADVLIVGRGGGSLEDLWPFNEEIVARAIHNCSLPVVSAVGHETDFCIADFVADVRAPTPSAAAELVSFEKSALLIHFDKMRYTLSQNIHTKVRSHKQLLASLLRQPVFASPISFLSCYYQKLDEAKSTLQNITTQLLLKRNLHLHSLIRQYQLANPLTKIAQTRERTAIWQERLITQLIQVLKGKKERLQHMTTYLQAIDPRNLLKKGYAILFSEKNRSLVLSSTTVEIEEQVRIQLSDGQLLATVKEKI